LKHTSTRAISRSRRPLFFARIGACSLLPTAPDPDVLSLHYIASIVRAVVPPLIPWATSVLAYPRITNPEDNDIVKVGAVRVSGTYRFACGLSSFVLLHHYDNKYWPQGSPVLDRTRHTWYKDVHVKTPVAEKQSISIAAITEEIRPLFNHYYQVGESTKQWHPIIWYQLPKGLTLLHTIRVQPKVA
jgi:hypothetical protein